MLIERETELAAVASAISMATSGRGQIVLVSGEAGIGKSTLLQAAREAACSAHSRLGWFQGGCEALFTPRTLGPIYDMAPDLGRVVEIALETDSGPSALYSAILSSLEKANPAVIIFEDMHWADHATLDLVKYLSRRLSLLNIVLILTFRDDEVGTTHSLNHVLGDLPGASTTRLKLKPLTQKGVARLAKHSAFSASSLHAITAGNPFYVSELVTNGRDDTFVPASVKDAVALRLSRMTPDARDLVERLSVMTTAHDMDFLEHLVGDQLADHLPECLSFGLLVDDDNSISFRHELTRRAIFDRLPSSRRRSYHLACLRLMEARAERYPCDCLVYHSSGAQDVAKVLQYAPKAAELAASAGAHIEAAEHYALALKYVNDAEPELAAHLYESWAYESTLADRMGEDVLDARRHAITLWRALKRQDKVGHNLRHLSRIHWYRGESAAAARYADQAIQVLEALPASPERGMAYSMRSQLHMLNDQMEAAVEWGLRALDFESDYPDPEIRMHALNNIGTAMIFRNNRDGLIHLHESLHLAKEHGHHENAARAYNNLAEYAVEMRDFQLAEAVLAEALEYDRQHDLDAWTHYLSGRLAQLRMDQGRLDEAISIANEVLSFSTPTLSRLPANLVISRARMRRGDAGAEALLRDALNDALATDEKQHIVPARLSMIEWAWLNDTTSVAMEHFQRLMLLTESDRHPWNIGERAIWADRFGIQTSEQANQNLPEPHRLELAGQYADAMASLMSLDLPYEAAMVGLRSRDAALISRGNQLLEDMGAHLALSKARRIAGTLGIQIVRTSRRRGPYQAARSHPLGLTGKEQQVLECLREGLSNREISEKLNRSQRTIEHHVSSILSKLNAPNRMAAILRLQREPWLHEPN